jgi:hypothetical protein
MKKISPLIFTLAIALLTVLLFTACNRNTPSESTVSVSTSTEDTTNSSTENGTTQTLTDTRTAPLEERQQALNNAFGHANCNMITITQVSFNEELQFDENTPYVYFETVDGHELFLSQDGFQRIFYNNGYSVLSLYPAEGTTFLLYYYGELAEDGNLGNTNVKSLIPEAWNEDISGQTYIEFLEYDLSQFADIPEHQVVLGYDEAIFRLLENGETRQFIEINFDVMINEYTVVEKVTLPVGGFYYLVDGVRVDPYFPYHMQISYTEVSYAFNISLPEDMGTTRHTRFVFSDGNFV